MRNAIMVTAFIRLRVMRSGSGETCFELKPPRHEEAFHAESSRDEGLSVAFL
jgi:hypothetical protein